MSAVCFVKQPCLFLWHCYKKSKIKSDTVTFLLTNNVLLKLQFCFIMYPLFPFYFHNSQNVFKKFRDFFMKRLLFYGTSLNIFVGILNLKTIFKFEVLKCASLLKHLITLTFRYKISSCCSGSSFNGELYVSKIIFNHTLL